MKNVSTKAILTGLGLTILVGCKPSVSATVTVTAAESKTSTTATASATVAETPIVIAVTSITPSPLTFAGGTITLAGAFPTDTTVKVGGYNCTSLVRNSASQVQCTAPALSYPENTATKSYAVLVESASTSQSTTSSISYQRPTTVLDEDFDPANAHFTTRWKLDYRAANMTVCDDKPTRAAGTFRMFRNGTENCPHGYMIRYNTKFRLQDQYQVSYKIQLSQTTTESVGGMGLNLVGDGNYSATGREMYVGLLRHMASGENRVIIRATNMAGATLVGYNAIVIPNDPTRGSYAEFKIIRGATQYEVWYRQSAGWISLVNIPYSNLGDAEETHRTGTPRPWVQWQTSSTYTETSEAAYDDINFYNSSVIWD